MDFRLISLISFTITLLLVFGLSLSNLAISQEFLDVMKSQNAKHQALVYLGRERVDELYLSGAQVIDMIIDPVSYPYTLYVDLGRGISGSFYDDFEAEPKKNPAYLASRALPLIVPGEIVKFDFEIRLSRNRDGSIRSVSLKKVE